MSIACISQKGIKISLFEGMSVLAKITQLVYSTAGLPVSFSRSPHSLLLHRFLLFLLMIAGLFCVNTLGDTNNLYVIIYRQ